MLASRKKVRQEIGVTGPFQKKNRKTGKRDIFFHLKQSTTNKLSEQNPDFKKFLQDVKIDFESKRVHRSEYDIIEKEIRAYIKNTLKIKPIA